MDAYELSVLMCQLHEPIHGPIWKDDGQSAWRVCIGVHWAIPVPFRREVDAKRAMLAIENFEFGDDEIYLQNRDRMRQVMIEALAW